MLNPHFRAKVEAAAALIASGQMTYDQWKTFSPDQRRAARDNSELHPCLLQYEGHRIECTRYGERVRFRVGISTGWKPWHIAVHNTRSLGGDAISPKEDLGVIRLIRKGPH